MSSVYRIAPIFLIRMAGVPFDAVEGLATPDSTALARRLAIAHAARAHAKTEAERFFRSRERLLRPDAYRALHIAVQSGKPPAAVAGDQPPVFSNYAITAEAVAALEAELTQTLEREVAAARHALLDATRRFLPGYLLFGAEGVRGMLTDQIAAYPQDEPFAQRNNAARKTEQSLLLYLQRVATKNDTFSEFGPSSWGNVEPSEKGVHLNPHSGIAAREVFLERWTAHAAASAINSDSEARAELNGSDLKVAALEAHAFEVLVQDVKGWSDRSPRNRWLSILQPLAELPGKFAAASGTSERAKILADARAGLQSIGAVRGSTERFLYSATNPIGEECVRQSEFRISQTLIDEVSDEAAPWIDLWRDSYAFIASRVAAGLRQIFDRATPVNGALPLPAFLQACQAAQLPLQGPGLVALAVMAFQEVKAAFRERLRPHAGDPSYDLTLDDCHVVRNSFKYPRFDEYTYPSADLQIAAGSIEAVAIGDYEWVVSELHPPVALLHHGFYWACPDKAQLNRAFASGVFDQPNFHFGFFAADFTAHTTVRIFDALPDLSYFVAPQRGNPRWRTVAPQDAEVYVDQETGDVRLRETSSRRYLGSFARAWLIPLGFHPFQFGVAPHTPRLRCGRVVVQRRTWTVKADEMPAGRYTGISRDLVSAIEHLRAIKDWPRYVYIRPTEQALRRSGAEGRDKDTKPVFIDLESYLFLEIFQRWLLKAGELEVTEMLPAPDQLLWREPDGRRTFELRTLVVPRS